MEEILGYKIGKLSEKIKFFVDSHLNEVNLGGGQYLVLKCILNDKNITQKEISVILGINKATTAKSVKRLVESNYIIREKRIGNHRSYKLICTEKAEIIVKEIGNLIEIEKMILNEGIEEKDLNIFLMVLNKMDRNLIDEFKKNEKRIWRNRD